MRHGHWSDDLVHKQDWLGLEKYNVLEPLVQRVLIQQTNFISDKTRTTEDVEQHIAMTWHEEYCVSKSNSMISQIKEATLNHVIPCYKNVASAGESMWTVDGMVVAEGTLDELTKWHSCKLRRSE